jgi:hypothetical protein
MRNWGERRDEIGTRVVVLFILVDIYIHGKKYYIINY